MIPYEDITVPILGLNLGALPPRIEMKVSSDEALAESKEASFKIQQQSSSDTVQAKEEAITPTERLQLQECPLMQFVSLGMLIIDDIYHPGPQASLLNVLGGAGTFATLGARLFCFSRQRKSNDFGYVVHVGSDFGGDVKSQIEGWKTGSRFIQTPERLTTRGKNTYCDGLREFEFLTNKIQINPDDLSVRMLRSRVYHLICTPARCIALVNGILEKRRVIHAADTQYLSSIEKPIFLWEPMEGSCRPEELESFYEALKFVDVFSPNGHELASLFHDPKDPKQGIHSREELKRDCAKILALGFGNKPSALVVRLGENGCFVGMINRFMNIPPWHSPKTILPSFDATGCGNTFMGGFAAGLLAMDELLKKGFTEFEVGAIYGSVAASFAIEQVGMPQLTHGADGEELWNGKSVQERLRLMRRRILRTLGAPPAVPQEKLREMSPFLLDGYSHKGEL